MKKYFVAVLMVAMVAGSSFASVETSKGGGKHPSHKKAKQKKSKYMYNFQH
ncbi:MAG TPA: hypothetical protein VNB90_02450 [Cytophagaceae bacterium]|jgi:hypothetical protein|nr:hypothetical protein [Cytophagaceae bacterium]